MIVLFLLFIWSVFNLTQKNAKFNLKILWLYPFSLHPFYNVHPQHDNNINRVIEHENVHLQQQSNLTVICFLILYLYYMISGIRKYGFEKTSILSVGRQIMFIKNKVYKFNIYNPLETEAYIRENSTSFKKIYPEYANSKVTAFSHKLSIYKSALI